MPKMLFKMKLLVILFYIVFGASGQTSDSATKPSDTLAHEIEPDSDPKAGIKVGSSGFSEFKGNLPIDKSYKSSFVSSVNVGSFVGQTLRSSSVLREAQLHSAASRAEMFAGMIHTDNLSNAGTQFDDSKEFIFQIAWVLQFVPNAFVSFNLTSEQLRLIV